MSIFNKRTLRVKKTISEHLVFRDSVSTLFQQIKQHRNTDVILDFSDVKSVSRSFAQEYLKQKKNQSFPLKEKKMIPDVKKMFDAAKKHQKKSFPLSFDDTKESSLNDLLQQSEKDYMK